MQRINGGNQSLPQLSLIRLTLAFPFAVIRKIALVVTLDYFNHMIVLHLLLIVKL
jgi:hypothetical protein